VNATFENGAWTTTAFLALRTGRFDDKQHASIAWASRTALRRRLI
jgi:hypothetical protein